MQDIVASLTDLISGSVDAGTLLVVVKDLYSLGNGQVVVRARCFL